ncbi:hypothetical protein PMAYCL1PPCAC_26197, partial [Pristionchus mayeri]
FRMPFWKRDTLDIDEEFRAIVRSSLRHRERRMKLAQSRMKKRNTAYGSFRNPRPYKVWKEHFIEDRGCERKQIWSEVVVSAIPHILLNLLLIGYIFLGAQLFRSIDPDIIKSGLLRDNVFFTFTTIATIGYGAEAPTTPLGKWICVAYCTLGIPLIFMVLANNGQFIVDAYWIFRNSYMRGTEEWNGEMPLRITALLLTLWMLVGGFLFSRGFDKLSYFDAVYYSFISVSTIGYGDIIVYPKDVFETVVMLLYFSVGMIFLTTLTGSLSNYLQKLHYFGRQFSGVSDVEVWFGGRPMTVKELITAVADQFETSPELLHYVLNDLDHILEVALNKDTEEAVEHLKMHGETVRKQSFVCLELGPDSERKVLVQRLNSELMSTATPQRKHTSGAPTEMGGKTTKFRRVNSGEDSRCSAEIRTIEGREVNNRGSEGRNKSEEESPSTATAVSFLLHHERAHSEEIISSPREFSRSLSRLSRNSTPLSKVPSDSSINEIVKRDSSKSLHALGVVYHAIQKRDSVRRSLSFRRHRPSSQSAGKRRTFLPAFQTVV